MEKILTGRPQWLSSKDSACNARDLGGFMGSIPRLGKPSGEGNGNSLQYSCLENPMDKETCWAIVHVVAKSWTWLRTDTHKILVTYISILANLAYLKEHILKTSMQIPWRRAWQPSPVFLPGESPWTEVPDGL